MLVLVLAGGALLAIALVLFEVSLARRRASQAASIEKLRGSLQESRSQFRRALEDLYVLHAVLADKHVIDEADLARGRARLIEAPRRLAQERNAILRHWEVSPTQLVIDEDITKVH